MNTETRSSTTTPPRPALPVASGQPLDSSVLLGNRDEIEISHKGETYRLRHTRQGKLILTK